MTIESAESIQATWLALIKEMDESPSRHTEINEILRNLHPAHEEAIRVLPVISPKSLHGVRIAAPPPPYTVKSADIENLWRKWPKSWAGVTIEREIELRDIRESVIEFASCLGICDPGLNTRLLEIYNKEQAHGI